jgi:hypothetical protein
LGVSAFNKADPGARGHRGMVRARTTVKTSGTASRPTIALWCNGITPWYKGDTPGRRAFAWRSLNRRRVRWEINVATISLDRMLDSAEDVAMPHADQMRGHASRLLAMALTARDNGQIEYSDRLTEQASDVLNVVKAVELVQHSLPRKE